MENDLLGMLLQDLSEEIQIAAKTTSQIQRRSVVRSGFATVEGCVHSIKELILDDLHLNYELHSAAEVAMLREENYNIDKKGNVQIQQKFIPTDANLRFTIKMLCRGTNDGELDLTNSGWQAFNSSLKLRHRLTHPKQLSDMIVSDAELRIFVESMFWFCKTISEKLAEVLKTAKVQPDNEGADLACE